MATVRKDVSLAQEVAYATALMEWKNVTVVMGAAEKDASCVMEKAMSAAFLATARESCNAIHA